MDDNLQINMVNMETAARETTAEGVHVRTKHAAECQNSFRSIVRKVEGKGMKVNGSDCYGMC